MDHWVIWPKQWGLTSEVRRICREAQDISADRYSNLAAWNISPSALVTPEGGRAPGFIGYGRLILCERFTECGSQALVEIPLRSENPRPSSRYRCYGCGAHISAQFQHTERVEEIPLGGEPPAALYAAPGFSALSNALDAEVARACHAATKDAGRRLREAVSKLADPDKWPEKAWWSSTGTPKELIEAATQALQLSGIPNSGCAGPYQPAHHLIRSNATVALFQVGYQEMDRHNPSGWVSGDLHFGRSGPNRSDIRRITGRRPYSLWGLTRSWHSTSRTEAPDASGLSL